MNTQIHIGVEMVYSHLPYLTAWYVLNVKPYFLFSKYISNLKKFVPILFSNKEVSLNRLLFNDYEYIFVICWHIHIPQLYSFFFQLSRSIILYSRVLRIPYYLSTINNMFDMIRFWTMVWKCNSNNRTGSLYFRKICFIWTRKFL